MLKLLIHKFYSQMVIFYLLFRLSSQQEFELAVQDISDDPLTMDGWQVSRKREFKPYASSIQKCNQNLLKLTPYPNIYQKPYQITHFEYDQVIFEMDVYFIQFQESLIRIKIDETIIFQQTFTSNTLKQNSVCGGSDSYFTINQKFYSKQTQFNLIIFYQTSDQDSYIGVRNINFYTNGYSLSNGCPMGTPYLQDSECVQYCTNPSAYLGGVDMLVCQTDETGEQSKLIGIYEVTQSKIWKFSNPTPSISQQQYLTNDNYLIRENLYDNIMISGLFSQALACYQSCYYMTQQIEPQYLLQITLAIYIFQEWNDGSFVGIYIEGDTIYKNNMVKIFKLNGKYYSSTGSKFHFTNITSIQNQVSTVRQTLISFQGKFYTSSVNIGFSQVITGPGYYGFGTLYVYQSYSDPNIVQSGLYGIPFQCAQDYYAYNGYCVQNCPPYAYQDENNNNCTDLSYQQSQIFDSNNQQSNRVGSYIVKDFYNNNFNQQTINSIFSIIPPTYNNYQNGQPFSFIGNKKILGGFNSWGYGSYGLYFNLPIHNQIRIKFKLYMIDNWSNQDYFMLLVDSIAVLEQHKDSPNQQIQGLSTQDQLFNVNFLQYHASSTLRIIFLCNIAQQNPSLASCGISDLFILYDQFVDVLCNSTSIYYSYFTNNCETCIGSNCVLYPTNYYINNLSEKELFGCQQRDLANTNECVVCSQPSYKRSGPQSSCVCGNSYVLKDLQCTRCHYTCETCFGTTENDCQTCDATRQLVGQRCECLSNSIDIFSQTWCSSITQSCDYSCGICFFTKYYHCATCPQNSFRIFSQYKKTCLCEEQYMDEGSPVCQRMICDPSCLTCNGLLQSNCLTCAANFRYDNGYCICDGQFNNLVNINSCTLNNPICNDMTCTNQSIQGFLDCDPKLFRFLQIISQQQQQCICFDGYFESQDICVLCDSECLTCQTTSTNCLSCDSNMKRYLYINLCKCISGYADIGNKLCEKCPSDCDDCDSQLKCISCKYQLQFINSAGRCECQKGYQKDNNGQCIDCQSEQGKAMFLCQYKNAQDGVWTYGEQCDDGNDDSRDGCNNNQITYGYSCTNVFNQPSICYKCPSNCQQCQLQQNQVICISCYSNYFISQSECIQCFEESCIECNTPSHCTACNNQKIPIQGKCNICEYGYYYENNQCQSLCGDGIKTIDEQCDDGNLLSNDGCSQICEIEDDFVCQTTNNKLSNCFIHEQPYLILNTPYQTSNKERQLIITVAQDVTYKDVQVQLKQNDQVQYQYYSTGTNSLIINVKLMFQQFYDQFTVDLTIKGSILNQYNQTLKKNQLQIIFSDIIILNNQQQQSSDQVSQLGQGVVITLTCLSVTSLLMGGISQFIIFLNLIQQLQYIQYINVDFPQNLIQFLNLFNGFTISPLFEPLQIQLPYYSPWQLVFAYNGINSYFIANMKGFILCLLMFYILDFILKFGMNLLQHYKYFQLEKNKLSFPLQCKINKIIRFLLRLSSNLRQQSLPQLVLAQCYDIQFATFMQLTNPDLNSLDVMLNFMLSCLMQFYFLKLTCNKLINTEIKNSKWQTLYNQRKLLQSLVFMFAIVQLQSFSQSQIIIISFSSLVVSYYMFCVQPFNSNLNNYRLLIQESILFITILTFIAYIYFPSEINPINLGWFHISSLILMLIGSIAIDIYYYVNIIKNMY